MSVYEIKEDTFLEALKAGVGRTTNLIGHLTEYHGGPVRTEYMMTADLAREFIERGYEVKVECKNRELLNALVALNGTKPAKALGSLRTDVALVNNDIVPLAMIEVKIGVTTLNPLIGDLDKVTKTIAMMQARFASKVIGACVFQVHIRGTKTRFYFEQFKALAEKAEKKIRTELSTYGTGHSDFRFSMHSLQEPDDGIVERDLEPDGDSLAWGQYGHATRYHAILIRSTRPVPPPPTTIEELKRVGEQ